MKIGFACASTNVHNEVMSGSLTDRPVLTKLVESLRTGDVLVICKLDRLGQSPQHLVDLVNDLMARKVGLKCLQDPIDSTTSHGRSAFNLIASLAEFEGDGIRKRAQACLSAAYARGRGRGRLVFRAIAYGRFCR